MIAHFVEDIRRFGVLMNMMTEVFESMNKLVRLRFTFSNNQAPGRDAAHDFAREENVAFLFAGGEWQPEGHGK